MIVNHGEAECRKDPQSLQVGVENEQPEFSVAGAASDSKNGAPSSDKEGGNSYDHLSGPALRGAFSKVLLRSALPASEKARILSAVTGEPDLQAKDEHHRRWLAKLQS